MLTLNNHVYFFLFLPLLPSKSLEDDYVLYKTSKPLEENYSWNLPAVMGRPLDV